MNEANGIREVENSLTEGQDGEKTWLMSAGPQAP
jgi:hypothetical protein